MLIRLAGKRHPHTGEPLRIKKLKVPPGSFISFCHHMPHWVGARAPDAPTRWAFLFAYRTPIPHVAAVNEEACLLVGEAAALAVAEGVGAEGVGAAAESKQ